MDPFDILWDLPGEASPSAMGDIPVIFRRTCGGIHTTITVYHPGLIRVQKGFSREFGEEDKISGGNDSQIDHRSG